MRWDADSNEILPSATSKLMSVSPTGELKHILPSKLQTFVQAKVFGLIAYNAAAPTPAETGEYTFSTAGLVSWLTVYTVDKNVVAGDKVLVRYTAPSTYAYELIRRPDNVASQMVNDSSVSGASVKHALENLEVEITDGLAGRLATFTLTNQTEASVKALTVPGRYHITMAEGQGLNGVGAFTLDVTESEYAVEMHQNVGNVTYLYNNESGNTGWLVVSADQALKLDVSAYEADRAGDWVGVIIDSANSCSANPQLSTVTAYRATELQRTGNLFFHKFGKSRIFNAFRPAIVNRATKKVDYWLDKDDMTKRSDGTASAPDWTTQNICIVVPDIYRRLVVVGTTTEIRMDIAAFDGAELWHEESAHSIGFANMDRTDGKLCSVISEAVRFRGGNNDAGGDGTNFTQLGKPATLISRTGFEDYAAAAGWETGGIKDRTLWHELYALYFANTNCQLAFTDVLTAEGFPQGGTGPGVTTRGGDWGTWNGYYPIHNTGVGTMAIGCKVGVHSITVNGYTEGIPVFFGIENLYGEIWEWCSGVNIEKSAEIANGGTGISSVYVNPDFAKRAATITADYTKVGEMARTDGWIKSLVPGWAAPLVTTGASDVAYMSDYGYCAGIPASGVDVYGLIFGSYASYGADAGVRSSYSYYGPSDAHSTVGSRLRVKLIR